MKAKMIVLLFASTLLLAFSCPAYASPLYDIYEDVTETDLKGSLILSPESSLAFINGHDVSGVQPIVREGRTLVPLRFVSEGLGAKVAFHPKDQSITIQYAGKSILLQAGKKTISIDGRVHEMDAAAIRYNQSTYIPLRQIGEALDKKVVYLKKTTFQPYSLIVIRDADAAAIENSSLMLVCQLLYQGKAMVYSDRFTSFIKENGQLFISTNFYSFHPFVYHDYVPVKNEVRLGDIWFNTDIGHFYLNYAFGTTQEFILYRVDGETITRVAVEKAPIKAVKTYRDDVYFLTSYERGLLNAHETTNLKAATFHDGKWAADFLGEPGYYYGFDTLGKAYEWPITDDGISTFGYQRSGNLSSEERKKTFGFYQLDLKGHRHERMTR
ncbi:copper amine oxidase N-terminal domain-containing protein [Paenibacillus sp. B01]|uniref:copper amine oxidase N-terminal domain-containing protein n=1 Tax=Paenibacillus sp. B01 TaxID=2660554 RepID=UPI00129B749B|nr:copper amine oxidase N-terminal domain-containing protein [Paenibacillus sp. B01]QGG54975.1 copper amine oxidase N-terminal domain-containing protein [Paenibacillus sp. B01]